MGYLTSGKKHSFIKFFFTLFYQSCFGVIISTMFFVTAVEGNTLAEVKSEAKLETRSKTTSEQQNTDASKYAEYIPRTILFTPPEVLAVKISPDANLLAFVKADPTGVMNLYVSRTKDYQQVKEVKNEQGNKDKKGDINKNNQTISNHQDSNTLKALTHFDSPEIYRFFWTGDSKHIVFLKDNQGTKFYQLYSVDVESGNLINHTENFKGVSSKIFKVSGQKVAVGINDRNPHYHDVFILDLSNGTLTRIFKNDEFSRFTFDENLKIAFKEKIHDDGSIDIYQENNQAGNTKGNQQGNQQAETFMHFSPEDAFHSRIIHLQNSTLYYVDSRNSDTTWLKSVDLKSGKESQIAHDPKSDIQDVLFVEDKPALYSTTWLYKEWHSLGKDNLDFLTKTLGTSFEITSQSQHQHLWVVRYNSPKQIGACFYLYDRENDKLIPLFISNTHPKLAEIIPFEFHARDGLKLTAYLTLPHTYSSIENVQKPLPLIVIPHGGPFQARDCLGYAPWHQWLASRGYAVLSVNFRLSSGLGKNLVNAGNGEWGRKALFDLIDAADWCIDHGITTKSTLGIMGGSYGGYTTLAALTFTPQEFAVGVSIAPPSSLVTVMQKLLKYWDWPEYPLSDTERFFTKGAFIKSMGGNPDIEEGKQFLASRSPLHFADKIERPLLIIQGGNDPIVKKEESEQIYHELVRLNKKVSMLLFPDEGHVFKRYSNIDVYLAHAEKWLHDTLGGQYEPLNPEFLKDSSVLIETPSP